MSTKYITPQQVLQQLSNLLLEHPELKDEDESWNLAIESETDVHELLRQIERERQEAASMAWAITKNIADMEQRQKRFENRERARRLLAFKIMQIADIRKAELPECTMSLRPSARHVIITNPEAIPTELQRIKTEPDKARIKDMLLDGIPVPGTVLSNGDLTISIRTR